MAISKPILVVVCDAGLRARIFLVLPAFFKEVGSVFVDVEFEKGGPGHARTAPGFVGAPTDDSDRLHWQKANRLRFYHLLNEELRTQWRKRKIEKIVLCLPARIKKEIFGHLTTDVATKIVKVIPKNLYSFSLTEIRRHLSVEIEVDLKVGKN